MNIFSKLTSIVFLFTFSGTALAHRDPRIGPHGGVPIKLKKYILEIVPFENQFFHVFVLDKKEKDVDLSKISLSASMNKTLFSCRIFEEVNFKCETQNQVTLDKGIMELKLTAQPDAKDSNKNLWEESGKIELPFSKHYPPPHH